jgi:hypothetical protein
MKQKKKEMKKYAKWPTQKRPPILNMFCQNFRHWSLGEQDQLMQRALILLNL